MHIQHRSSEFPSVFQGWFFCPLGQVFLKIKHGLQLFPRKVQELGNEDLCYHNCISVLLTQLLTSLFSILLWINCSLTDISACVLYGQEVVTNVLVCKEFLFKHQCNNCELSWSQNINDIILFFKPSQWTR